MTKDFDRSTNQMDDNEIKIERGIPLPPLPRQRFPFPQMEPGDSFPVPQLDLQHTRSAANAYGKRHGQRYRVLKQADGSFRCWRVS